MTLLSNIRMQNVYEHYIQREAIYRQMVELFTHQNVKDFVRLALGISDERANYSASEYGAGSRILQRSPEDAVFLLAKDLYACSHPKYIPGIIHKHDISCLKISIGSEISMMLQPNDFWVANVRTIWAYLLIKHADNYKKANEELELYRDGE